MLPKVEILRFAPNDALEQWAVNMRNHSTSILSLLSTPHSLLPTPLTSPYLYAETRSR